ncbi:hypothetical protein M378DRAFT_18641, partial [Amanita muscaria Koide BX008]
QDLEEYEAFEGPVTGHELSDGDEQRGFYGALSDISASDDEQTLLAGKAKALPTLTFAQQMEQLSQGISVCSEGEFTSIIQPSVSLQQYLEDYEAFEGPVTDHEWSDDDEQRVFYSTLGDVSTSDNGQTLLYSASCEAAAGVSPALQRVDEELTPLDSPHVTPAVQRVDEGRTLLDALHVSPPVQRVDEEPMPLYAALSDMSISDGDSQPATAHALLAPLVQRTKAEKEVAFKKARMNKKRALRKKRREQDRAKEGTDMKHKTKKRRTEARKDAFKVNFAMGSDAPRTKSSWLGKPQTAQDGLPTGPVSKDDLVEKFGLKCIPWDGQRPHVILDKEGLVVGALAGQPRDPDWHQVHNAAFEALGSAASRIRYHAKEVTNRRGSFPTVAYGISFGGGQLEPGYLRHGSPHKEKELERLLKNKAVQRLCGFASCAFNAYSERNYNYMRDTVKTIKAKLNIGKDYESKLGAPRLPLLQPTYTQRVTKLNKG